MIARITYCARRWSVLRFVGWLAMLSVLPVSASQRLVVDGWVGAASSPFDDCDYVLRSGPGEPVKMGLSDPWRRISGALPGHHRLTVELTSKWYDQSTGSVPKVVVFHVHPPSTMACKGLSCGADPGRFAACDNGMYPRLVEPLPRNLSGASSGGGAATDADGDGVPDSLDAFPNDPTETVDTDGDGTGNNADPDDDGDLIPDLYELQNKLNPLVNDASGDLDGDGQTNLKEAVAGSRANDASSYFRIERITPLSRGTIGVGWFALPGRDYSILYTPDLTKEPRILADRITVPDPGMREVTVDAPDQRGFYFLEVTLLNAP